MPTNANPGNQVPLRTHLISESGYPAEHEPNASPQNPFQIPEDLQVLLVAMPFGSLVPSIALGTVKTTLKEAGFKVDTLHVELEYLQFLLRNHGLGSVREYEALSKMCDFNEWVFTAEDFHGVDRVPDREEIGDWHARFPAVRTLTRRFLDTLARQVVASRPRIVGFSLVFSQKVASLVLAKRIKELAPGTRILLGGVGCSGGVGDALLRHCPWVDAVYHGDAEGALPDLVPRLLAGDGPGFPYASVRREDGAIAPGTDVHKAHGEAFAVPDYDEYFSRLQRLQLESLLVNMYLPFESSRGCWWGVKHACTFCAINVSLEFRRKPWEKVVEELHYLADRHACYAFAATDSILDYRDAKALCGALADSGRDWKLYYMTKGNLNTEAVLRLRSAGLTSLNPGLESLSTPILKLMDKGSTAIQNIRMLKVCAWLGIHVDWTILCGFPGEDPEEYARMASLAKQLMHLDPPKGVHQIFLERGSAFYNDPKGMGIEILGPYSAYAYLYPLQGKDLEALSHRFAYRYADGRKVETYTAGLKASVDEWQKMHARNKGGLTCYRMGAKSIVVDQRRGAFQRHLLDGAESLVHDSCFDLTSLATLAKEPRIVAAGFGPEALEGAVQALTQKGLLYREGDQVISLALPAKGQHTASTA